jgi:hypothetical protein
VQVAEVFPKIRLEVFVQAPLGIELVGGRKNINVLAPTRMKLGNDTVVVF